MLNFEAVPMSKSILVPDHWVIVELPSQKGYKVLGGWNTGTPWRLNSGIKTMLLQSAPSINCYVVTGFSGSVYHLGLDKENATVNMQEVLSNLEKLGAKVIEAKSLYNNQILPTD